MIIEFSIGNFRSIKNIQTISLAATSIISKEKKLDDENTFNSEAGIKLLKSIAVYGANGSGKSNIVKGLISMMYFIKDSFALDEAGSKLYDPFLLDSISKSKPTFYQVIFILEKKVFRYGFELKENKVVSEWLFGTANKNEVYFFKREKNKIKINKKNFPEGIGLEERTKETTVFLNVVDAFNGKISKSIKNFFRDSLIIGGGLDDTSLRTISYRMLEDEKSHSDLIKLFEFADIGIKDIEKVTISETDLPVDASKDLKEQLKKNKKLQLILSVHKVVNNKGIINEVKEPFHSFESEGTKKYFNLAGVILTSLSKGVTLVIDEFDARLHPLITKRIVQLYNSSITNKNKAQLIFITHDTNLLDSTLLRRDQIYFAEKNKKNESLYYSLVNIGGVRNDASFEKDYVKGKYGAVPFIGEYKIQ